jgi:DNA-binding transcriptional ArsR family regulator
MYEALFGNKVAENVLLYIVNYGEGHINGIAKTFDIYPSQVDRQLKRLEAASILVSRDVGNMRMFALNPRLPIKNELSELLERILGLLSDDQTQSYFRERRRPRRSGKRL